MCNFLFLPGLLLKTYAEWKKSISIFNKNMTEKIISPTVISTFPLLDYYQSKERAVTNQLKTPGESMLSSSSFF